MRPALRLLAIRPKVAAPAVKATPKARINPVGLAFLLGGLALASWLAKPSKTQPIAAMDTLKPRVAIVFVLGDSKGNALKFAQENGFGYVRGDSKTVQDEMKPLVEQGISKFVVDGVPSDPKLLSAFEHDIVECDVTLDYADTAPEYLQSSRRVEPMKDKTISEVLKERNLI